MKLQGNSLRRLVERYEEKYPDQFPKNKDFKEYKDTIATHKEMMKKRIQRLKNFIEEFAGDKTKLFLSLPVLSASG